VFLPCVGILHSDNVVFYHPCNSLTDGDGNLWTTPDPDNYWPTAPVFEAGGVIDNRFHGAVGISDFTRPGFGNMLGGTRITWAAWMDLSVTNSLTFIGFMGGGPGFRGSMQSIRLDEDGGRAYLYTGDVDSSNPGDIVRWGNVVNTAPGWHLYVLDVRWVGGTDWVLSHSVDGAAFTTESSLSWPSGPSGWVNSPSDAAIVSRDALVDEVVLWRDLADPFTSTELQNLYDLSVAFGARMDEYEQTYEGAPICWQATAQLLDGSVWRDSGSGLCPPVVRVPHGAKDVIVTDNGRIVEPRIIEG